MEFKKTSFLHAEIFAPFSEHIQRTDNSRILFSAPFGNGKSTFLNEFFKSNESDFIYINLHPVNYSVASDRDVFELIKYDLLSTLIEKYSESIDLRKEDFNFLLASQVFIGSKAASPDLSTLIAYLIEAGELVGKTAEHILKPLSLFIKDVKEFQQKMSKDEASLIKQYLTGVEQNGGSIYGIDSVSKLISDFITRIKENNESKSRTSVLIIDDLDRLDPDHIFRLFNIFSTQHSSYPNNNKFNFDKVIFVCDINNIRNIFYYKYGLEVDFNGYIDKFYSDEVFHFDNISLIKKALQIIINKTPYKEQNLTDAYSVHSGNRLYVFFEWIAFSLMEARLLNLRSIIAMSYLSFPNYTFRLKGHPRDIKAYESGALLVFYILKQLLGSAEIVKQALKKLAGGYGTHPLHAGPSHYSDGIEGIVMTYLLPLILPPSDGFPFERKDTQTIKSYRIPGKDIIIRYQYENNMSNNRALPFFFGDRRCEHKFIRNDV